MPKLSLRDLFAVRILTMIAKAMLGMVLGGSIGFVVAGVCYWTQLDRIAALPPETVLAHFWAFPVVGVALGGAAVLTTDTSRDLMSHPK
jgi:hypothetical protein